MLLQDGKNVAAFLNFNLAHGHALDMMLKAAGTWIAGPPDGCECRRWEQRHGTRFYTYTIEVFDALHSS